MRLKLKGVLSVILLMFAVNGQAGLITAVLAGNDCSGYFGQGLNNCAINGSPLIVKYNEGGATEISNAFNSINGNEFSYSTVSGTWTYNQGVNDPDVRFWVAKGGPSFRVHYMVDDSNDGLCLNSLSVACLDLALTVTGGDFMLPINPNNDKPYGLSHLSFYDTGRTEVSEPAALLLFGLGLICLAAVRRIKTI